MSSSSNNNNNNNNDNKRKRSSKTNNNSNNNNNKLDKTWYRNGYGMIVNEPNHGQFTTTESNQIREAILSYCTEHNVSTNQICSDIDVRSDELRGAWRKIAQVLGNRTVQSVYRHGLRIMHPFKRGKWTDEEVVLLKELVSKHGKRWALIQKELQRSSESCRDKYRETSVGYRKGTWLEEESNLLENHIREAVGVGKMVTMREIANMIDEKKVNISWIEISNKVKSRARLSCYKRFQKLSGATQSRKRKSDDKSSSSETHPTNTTTTTTATTTTIRTTPSTSGKASKKHPRIEQENYSSNKNAARQSITPSSSTTTAVTVKSSKHVMDPSTNSSTTVAPTTIHAISMSTPNPIRTDILITSSMGDEEIVTAIASSSCESVNDVHWEAMDVRKRWEEMVDALVAHMDQDEMDDTLNRPLWEIAKIMLPGDENDEVQAELAARTVEAVFKFDL